MDRSINQCGSCHSQELVVFHGRWGSNLNWAYNASICAACGQVEAEDSQYVDSLTEER